MKLKSKPDPITTMIGDLVSMLPKATGAFQDLVSSEPQDRVKILEDLHGIEVQSDELYLNLLRKVVDTFITPYDREDIYRMVENLDDVIDEIEHTSILIVELGLHKLPTAIVQSADELHTMSESVKSATKHIKKPKKMEKHLFAVNDSENQLDILYRETVINALADDADPLQATRLTVIARSIELIASYLDNFTRALAVTAIKET